MSHFFLSLLPWAMLAAAVGGALGWYLRSIEAARTQSGLEKLWSSRMQMRDQELEARRVTSRVYAAKASALATELARRNARVTALEARIEAIQTAAPSPRGGQGGEVEVPVRRGNDRDRGETRGLSPRIFRDHPQDRF